MALSADQLDKLLAARDGGAALLFLALLRHEGRSVKQAAQALGLSPADEARAARMLAETGLLTVARPAGGGSGGGLLVEEPPVYNAAEIARGVDKDARFRALVSEAERVLSKVLSSSDLQILYAIYDWRGFPPGVIALLLHHCVSETRARLGPDRLPTLRQIDREAAYWEKRGLLTEALAEEFIRQREAGRRITREYAIKLQITGRAPTATEAKYLEDWALMGFSPEVVYQAYDITVVKTGQLTWKYCHAILKSWHEQGLHTPDALEKNRGGQPGGRASPPGGAGSEIDEMERMLRQLRREEDAG